MIWKSDVENVIWRKLAHEGFLNQFSNKLDKQENISFGECVEGVASKKMAQKGTQSDMRWWS